MKLHPRQLYALGAVALTIGALINSGLANAAITLGSCLMVLAVCEVMGS